MIQVILLWVVGLWSGCLHPFHLSICEIEHDTQSESLQITIRLFQDDFELALDKIGGPVGFFSETEEAEAKKILQQFFDSHLKITVDKKDMTHQLLGFELEDNVVWCYLEIVKVPLLQEVTVRNTVLLDTFDDQINLAHIRYQGHVKSLKFQGDQLAGTAAFTR